VLKNTKARVEKKRAEAEARQVVYNKLSLKEKLERTKPGTKQYKKLTNGNQKTS
jgi:hypothetical protein